MWYGACRVVKSGGERTMKVNTLGQFLRFYREKHSFQQDKVCSGICSLATLSRVENGSKIVDSLVAEALLGRIGQKVLQFELLLNDNDHYLWIIRERIQKYVEEGNYNEVKELLGIYRLKMPKGESVHEQFCLYYEAQMAIKKGNKTINEICEILYRALKLTKPEMDSGNEDAILYNPIEIDLIMMLIRYGYSVWHYRDAESELLKLFCYVEKVYSGTQREETGSRILLELISLVQHSEQYSRVIRYVDKAVDFISRGRGMDYIAELHFIKAKALEILYRENDRWTEQENFCKEECLMAYYVFDIFKQEKEKQEVQRFCEDKLGWQIIE